MMTINRLLLPLLLGCHRAAGAGTPAPPIVMPNGCVYLQLPEGASPGTDEERGCFSDWASEKRILRKGVPT